MSEGMIKVGMADVNVCHAPGAITTLGLGSCVGVVLYDRYNTYHSPGKQCDHFRNILCLQNFSPPGDSPDLYNLFRLANGFYQKIPGFRIKFNGSPVIGSGIFRQNTDPEFL